MRIGVTGSNGFIGRTLLNSLRSNSLDAVPIVLPKSPDVFDPSVLERALAMSSLDVVVHLAAIRNPTNDYEFSVNAKLPALLEKIVARRFPAARFIHISSINTVISERCDAYSVSKRRAENELKDSAAIIVRPGIIWSWKTGQGGDAERLRNYLSLPLPFHPIPFPGQLYRPVIVEDFADRLAALIAEKDAPSVINVLGGMPVTIWELAKCLSSATKVKLLPVPTAFLEIFFPAGMLRHIPVPLRSTDSTTPENSMGLPADLTWELPFSIPFRKNTGSQ